jgi:hypothetical protein
MDPPSTRGARKIPLCVPLSSAPLGVTRCGVDSHRVRPQPLEWLKVWRWPTRANPRHNLPRLPQSRLAPARPARRQQPCAEASPEDSRLLQPLLPPSAVTRNHPESHPLRTPSPGTSIGAAARSRSWNSRRLASNATTVGISQCSPRAPSVLVGPSCCPPPVDVHRRPAHGGRSGVEVDVSHARPRTLEMRQPCKNKSATAAPRRWSLTAASSARDSSRSRATPSAVVIRTGLTDRTGLPASAPIFTASSITWASVGRWCRTVHGASSRPSVDCHSATGAVVELGHRQLAQGPLDPSHPIPCLRPRRRPHRVLVHVVGNGCTGQAGS